jgi:hypothetical protein
MEIWTLFKYIAITYGVLLAIAYAGYRITYISILHIANTAIDYYGPRTWHEIVSEQSWRGCDNKDMRFWGNVYDVIGMFYERLVTSIPYVVSTFSSLVLLWVLYDYFKT